jgi:predicted transcriptional regulator of viral defense system
MKRAELVQKIEALGIDAFSMNDLRKLFPEEAHLRMSVKRMLDAGVMFPITRSLYALKQAHLDIEKIATQVYYPSYISFESALSKYGVINQGSYGLSLATTRHTRKIVLAGVECMYSQIQKDLFFGFDLVNGIYLAHAEKAFLDQIYLMYLGKRSGNHAEWELDGIDPVKLKEYLKSYNQGVKAMVEKMGL